MPTWMLWFVSDIDARRVGEPRRRRQGAQRAADDDQRQRRRDERLGEREAGVVVLTHKRKCTW